MKRVALEAVWEEEEGKGSRGWWGGGGGDRRTELGTYSPQWPLKIK